MLAKLEGAERASFIEEMRPHFLALKRGSSSRQIQALEKLMATTPSSPATSKAGSRPSSSALQVDINSAAPTPVLTMEPNSPNSSPPSTNASAVGDAPAPTDDSKAKAAVNGDQPSPAVIIEEAES
jgi:mRNA-binding protein PUF3